MSSNNGERFSDANERIDVYEAFGAVARELAEVKTSIANGNAQLHARIDGIHSRIDVILRTLGVVEQQEERMREKLDSVSEITGMAPEVQRIVRGARARRKLQQRLIIAALLAGAAVIGASAGAWVVQRAGFHPAQPVEVGR